MLSNNIVAQDVTQVKRLADYPILVCTLQNGYFLLDLNTDEPMQPTDYIPFQGEPVYADGSSWGGAPEFYGLEARG